MEYKEEVAWFLHKLARSKGNWGGKFDRLEHYKRFPNRDEIVKEYSKKEWILIQKKQNYTNISLNTRYKKEIIEFIEEQLPDFKGTYK